MTRPCIEVVGDGDGTTDAVGRADRPELVERRSSVDRRLVYADGVVDVVCSTVRVDSTQELSCATRVIGTVRFDDVILDEWVFGPSIDRQVAVRSAIEATTVRDRSKFVKTIRSISANIHMNMTTN